MKKLNEIFDVTYGNKLDFNKMLPLSIQDGGVNFVGRSSQNNGVSGTVSILEGIHPYEAGHITVALGGTKLLSSFIQEAPFYTAQNVAVLKPKKLMSFAEKLYVCLCIRNNRFRYSAFGREANRTLRYLPIPESSEFPDWVNEVDVEMYDDIQEPAIANEAVSDQKLLLEKRFKLVPLGDVFDVRYGVNLELNKMTRDSNGINFVSRTAKNNGVSAKVGRLPDLEPIEAGVLTVAGGGSVLETFLQREPFYSGRDLYYLKPLVDMTVEQKLFYCVCVRANQYRFSYGRQANRTMKNLMIPAPETDLMIRVNTYIKSLPYSSQL